VKDGVGVTEGHNPANSIVNGAPYCSTIGSVEEQTYTD
jgi:hypothetical protein